MNRSAIRVLLLLAVLLSCLAFAQQQPPAPPAPHNDVVIKNAIVMTVTHGNIKNGSRLHQRRQDRRGR